MKTPDWNRYREMVMVRNTFLVVKILGYILVVSAFVALYAVVSHSDSVTLWNICEETWTLSTYVKIVSGAVSCGIIGCGFVKIGSMIYERTSSWVYRFESYWTDLFLD